MKSYDDIAACAARYAFAHERHVADSDTLDDYEAFLRARVGLAECLVASGWSPPVDVQHLLALDKQLLAEPRGVMEQEPRLPVD